MTLEYLEIMEDMKKQEKEVQGTSSPRRKLQKSFKSNTRIYDDGSIEVDPQAQGEPSQKEVKKVDVCRTEVSWRRARQGGLLPQGAGQADEGHPDQRAATAGRGVPDG